MVWQKVQHTGDRDAAQLMAPKWSHGRERGTAFGLKLACIRHRSWSAQPAADEGREANWWRSTLWRSSESGCCTGAAHVVPGEGVAVGQITVVAVGNPEATAFLGVWPRWNQGGQWPHGGGSLQ